MKKAVVIIGYGGLGFVATEALIESGHSIRGYCDAKKKTLNPFNLEYLGLEYDFFSQPGNCQTFSAFIPIGDDIIREKAFLFLQSQHVQIINAQHPSAVISKVATLGSGILMAANVNINPVSVLGNGIICNTACSIDHDCIVGDFAHIGPNTVLCGHVTVGKHSFVGGNSVVKTSVSIGDNIIVGAGATVVKNLSQPGIYAGTPAIFIRAHKERLVKLN